MTLVFFMIDEFMMNQIKSLPYGWALCGRTEQSSPLVEKDGVPSGTKPESTGGIPK
jgi:hypothetical protein